MTILFVSQPISNLLANYIGSTFKIYPKRAAPSHDQDFPGLQRPDVSYPSASSMTALSAAARSSPRSAEPYKGSSPTQDKGQPFRGLPASMAASLLRTPSGHHPRIFCSGHTGFFAVPSTRRIRTCLADAASAVPASWAQISAPSPPTSSTSFQSLLGYHLGETFLGHSI